MNYQHFDNWSEAAKKFQEPLQAIAELNVKTLQGLTDINPDQYIHAKEPVELLEKQVNLAVETGHKAIKYWQDSFNIMEKAMLNFVQDIKQGAKNS